MKITVCIKQVPASSKVQVDPETGVLIRDGADTKMNPYDLTALEEALCLKDALGAEVTALTMGPLSAKEVLLEALFMGADHGVLLSDRRFGGADVLSTAYTLSSALKLLGQPDLILTGKQTTDGDTAQVGPEIAAFLDYPQYSNVRRIRFLENGALGIVSALGSKLLEAEIRLPCVLSLDSDLSTPRLPSYRRRLLVKEALSGSGSDLLRVLTLDDLPDKDPEHYGLKGSATSVEKIFPPDKKEDRKMLDGSAASQAQELARILKETKLL